MSTYYKALIGSVIVYLILSLCSWTLVVGDWHIAVRVIFGILLILVWGIIVSAKWMMED